MELTLEEFKYVFRLELEHALHSFIWHMNRKRYFPWKAPADESDFYFDLCYNFNNYSEGLWFVEKIK